VRRTCSPFDAALAVEFRRSFLDVGGLVCGAAEYFATKLPSRKDPIDSIEDIRYISDYKK
jgi:hypothetical protein